MNSNVISVDTKVELEFFNKQDEKLGTSYVGMFDEILDEMEVVVRFPAGRGPLPSVYLESVRVSALFHHELHGQLRFKGNITHKEQTGYGSKFAISIDDDFNNIQKREYFRPLCNAKAEYRLVKNSSLNEDNNQFKPARTRNISYTGARILLEKTEEISEEDILDLVVWIRENANIQIRCKVMRVYEFESRGNKSYDLGLTIESLNEKDRQLLVEYITRCSMVRSLYWGESP